MTTIWLTDVYYVIQIENTTTWTFFKDENLQNNKHKQKKKTKKRPNTLIEYITDHRGVPFYVYHRCLYQTEVSHHRLTAMRFSEIMNKILGDNN